MKNHLILRSVTRLMLPLIVLYGLYVQFHGDYSPGGGFQAGVIIAVAFIIYGVVFGMKAMERVCPPMISHRMMGLGALIYASVGVWSMLKGYSFLDYTAISPQYPVHGQHVGILIVEFGVGVTVTGVMISIFHAFATRKPTLEGKDF